MIAWTASAAPCKPSVKLPENSLAFPSSGRTTWHAESVGGVGERVALGRSSATRTADFFRAPPRTERHAVP